MAAEATPAPSSASFHLILGSSSVARRKILTEMGYKFEVMTANIDEKSIRREKPDELVLVLAEAKADAIMSRMNISDYRKDGADPTLLITSDIVVVHKGIIKEKPTTKEEASQFLKGYSGGHVSTVGSVVVTNLKSGKRCSAVDIAEVYFHEIPDEVIQNLVNFGKEIQKNTFLQITNNTSNEVIGSLLGQLIHIDEGVVFNVAGGLLLEHPLILPVVEAVIGTTDSVMGLPKALTEKLIHDALGSP